MSLEVTIGRVVWRGTQAALALTAAVVGLTWLNRVAASVMTIGGSCGRDGRYEMATPCPQGAWMAPVGILVALGGLGLYLLRRPAGSPQFLLFAWPALFGSLGVQFLRAAAAETSAYGFWLCGVVFLLMAAAPVALVLVDDRRAVVALLVGDGRAGPRPAAPRAPSRVVRTVAPAPVAGVDDLAVCLDRLSRLHRLGDLTDAEFAEAKQRVLDGV